MREVAPGGERWFDAPDRPRRRTKARRTSALVVLPPAAALRAFEAAARRGSFAAAARELNVSPSAVSHQLRHLEALWGLPLFLRGRVLALTPAGERLAPVVRRFLVSLGEALGELRGTDRPEPLRISCTQSFAAKWLLPRLPGFEAAHPGVNIWISASDALARLDGHDADAAIRIGVGPWERLHAEELLREYVFPVASPMLLERFGPVGEPADLLRLPLILRSGENIVPRWEQWFERVGLADAVIPEGARFPDTAMTVEAALDHQGAALVRSGHVSDELRSGRLVKLLDVSVPSPIAYHLVCPPGAERRPAVAAFRAWLLEQAAAAQELYDARDGGGVMSDRSSPR